MVKIIMCTYNGAKYIREQLQSIADNSEDNWNIFISDDQSTDTTIKIVEEYQKKYPGKIVYKINSEKQGVIANFLNSIYEVGSQMTDQDFIMLCDQDDIWKADKIKKTLKSMKELVRIHGNSIPLLVCTDATVVDDEMNVINESFRNMNHYHIKKLDLPHLMMENKVQGCTTMVNKSMAMMLDRLPQKATMHDSWLALIAAVFGKLKYIDEPTMKYRQHNDNIQGSIEYKDDVKNKFSNLGGQRQIVMNTTPQAAEFLEMYGDKMPDQVKAVVKAFATLSQQSFFVRRYHIIKYHMWKSGILRNIGLMVLI
ncbi:MAG: glycosyltransferase family 2 protein [Lachnospiraceae bacterium]|nr:glycosyltransferase family 2 protein [Lachnospiraceae bacterium]